MIKHNINSSKNYMGKITNEGLRARYNFLNSMNSMNSMKSMNNMKNMKNIMETVPTFNVLVSTIARESLENLIDSLSNELTENDCLTIVFDNNTKRDIKNINKIKAKVIIYNEDKKLGFWGHGIRNKYSSLLEKRDFILHADDDDTYFPDSFDKLRKQCINSNVLYIAKIMRSDKFIIPFDGLQIIIGNIGTPCGIIPYNYNLQSNWGHFYGGDGQFYIDLIKKIGRVKRLNTIIYNCNNTAENLKYYNLIGI